MGRVVAEITVIPVGSVEMKPCIDAAIEAIQGCGLKYEVGALGTTIEGPLDKVVQAVEEVHKAAMNAGVERLVTEVRIDERRGVDHTIEREVEEYRITMAPGSRQEALAEMPSATVGDRSVI